jgi:hypothetical protein
VPFSGRLGKRKLPAGPYRALLSATDDAGNTGASRTLTFLIARR